MRNFTLVFLILAWAVLFATGLFFHPVVWIGWVVAWSAYVLPSVVRDWKRWRRRRRETPRPRPLH